MLRLLRFVFGIFVVSLVLLVVLVWAVSGDSQPGAPGQPIAQQAPPPTPFEPRYLLPIKAGPAVMCCNARDATDKTSGNGSAFAESIYGLDGDFEQYVRGGELWANMASNRESPREDIQTLITASRVSESECLSSTKKGTAIKVLKHNAILKKDMNAFALVSDLSWWSSPWCFSVGVMRPYLAKRLGDKGIMEIANKTAEWADQFLPAETVPSGVNLSANSNAFDEAQRRKLE